MDRDPISAVPEEAATGGTAAIFADLRATLRVPFVNLIWRHLATMPGMLEWTWTLVKPLQASAELREAADALRASVQAPGGLKQPACVYDAVGVTSADRVVIGTMLRDYNAANAANLLSLLVAQSVLAGHHGQGRAPAVPASREPCARMAGPRLPGLDELSPATLALVLELDTFGRFAATQAVASLYRHLGHWP
ncbi:MAG TPA: halocarboxylic acid dehydrogenase DehI family protein, partial [Acetobacteraceae bacterium]|nr:halocarboxylic acid dehydrogenase DehI family protein [Acetobacteraceae bacterium]